MTREQYQQACAELDAALRREVRAQTLLREQNAQLRDLGNLNTSLETEKDERLTDTVQVREPNCLILEYFKPEAECIFQGTSSSFLRNGPCDSALRRSLSCLFCTCRV